MYGNNGRRYAGNVGPADGPDRGQLFHGRGKKTILCPNKLNGDEIIF